MNSILAKLVLLFIFIKIGAVSFGGAYSIWGMVEQEFVEDLPEFVGEKTGQLPEDKFYQYMEVGRMTPGPDVNGVLLVGNYYEGILGMVLVFVGLLIPSVLSMIALYHLNRRLRLNAMFEWFKQGGLAAVIAVLVFFLYRVSVRVHIQDVWQIVAFCLFTALLFVLIHHKKANVILVTLYSGLVTWAFHWFW